MAYLGSTQLSSLQNAPILLVRGMGQISSSVGDLLYSTVNTSAAKSNAQIALGGGTGLWYYQSSDPSTTVVGTVNYFTDGQQLGMRNGDIMFLLAPSSGGSTTVLLGIAALQTSNTTAGFGLQVGTQLLSTQ